jgi:hypothetical protein
MKNAPPTKNPNVEAERIQKGEKRRLLVCGHLNHNHNEHVNEAERYRIRGKFRLAVRLFDASFLKRKLHTYGLIWLQNDVY